VVPALQRACRALTLLAVLVAAPVAWANPFNNPGWGQVRPDISNVYVFGDSLSDGGAGIALVDAGCKDATVASLVCGHKRNAVRFGKPFYQGRSLSDGPVAMDVMARLLGKSLRPGYFTGLIPGVDRPGENYAISGAHAHGTGFNVMFSLNGQIGAYERHYGKADPKALHVLFIGANDVLNAIDAQDPAKVDLALQEIQRGLDRLSDKGARQFLVYKLMDLGDVPKYVAKPALRQTASAYTERFNRGIDALTAKAGVLHRFDMQAFWNFTKQVAYGQKIDYKNACVSPISDLFAHIKKDPAVDVTIAASYLPTCPPAQREHRVFFDELHPSGYMHQLLGIASYDFVVERLTGKCGIHAWGNDAPSDRGEPNNRRGLPGSVYRYDNPYNGQREYLRLVNLGTDSAYWYFPINRRDNTYWQYFGTQPPRNCGTPFPLGDQRVGRPLVVGRGCDG